MTGIITGWEVGKNKNSSKNVVLLQVRISDEKDIQTIELMTPAGDDSIPPLGAKVAILTVSNSYKIAIAQSDNIESTMDIGEKKIYSQENGIIKAYANWLKSGIIEINGNADFAVAFNDLKSGFDTLKSDLNTFIGIFNAHVHVETGASTLPTATPGTVTAASIDASKIDTVKVP